MNWKLILQQSWKKTLLVGGLLFIIGCTISFFLFANKMALLIGLPFWFYEKGIIPSLGDLEDHTIFSTISLLADVLFWLLVAFFAVINKKFRWAVILILLALTVFTIYNFYMKSISVQTGAPPSPVELCETDSDCINVITGDTEGYKAQACVNKNYKDYNLQPYDYPGKILSETGEDKCDCSQLGLGETTYKICGFKSEINTSDWQTYRNEEYGFELNMPIDWKISEERNNFFVISYSTDQLTLQKIYLRIEEKILALTKEQYILKTYGSASYGNNCIISQKQKNLKYLSVIELQDKCTMGKGLHEIFDNSKYIFDVEFLMGDIEFFNQILSTFKFTK